MRSNWIICIGLLLGLWVSAGQAFAQDEVEPEGFDLDALAELLMGDDDGAMREARSALLLHPLDHAAQVRLLEYAQSAESLDLIQPIVKHHILATLREEEFEDAEPESVVVGFRFVCRTTASVTDDLDEALAADYAWGAQVQSTTPGFPGMAYLRAGDVIVAIDDAVLPAGVNAAQAFLIASVADHEIGQHVGMTLIRAGEAMTIDVPLVHREAMTQMYGTQGTSTSLLDPFLFLWEDAWATLLFEADKEDLEPASSVPARPSTPGIPPAPLRLR